MLRTLPVCLSAVSQASNVWDVWCISGLQCLRGGRSYQDSARPPALDVFILQGGKDEHGVFCHAVYVCLPLLASTALPQSAEKDRAFFFTVEEYFSERVFFIVTGRVAPDPLCFSFGDQNTNGGRSLAYPSVLTAVGPPSGFRTFVGGGKASLAESQGVCPPATPEATAGQPDSDEG